MLWIKSRCCFLQRVSHNLRREWGVLYWYRAKTLCMNEWVLIRTCKQLVWSTRTGRNMPIWILVLVKQIKWEICEHFYKCSVNSVDFWSKSVLGQSPKFVYFQQNIKGRRPRVKNVTLKLWGVKKPHKNLKYRPPHVSLRQNTEEEKRGKELKVL